MQPRDPKRRSTTTWLRPGPGFVQIVGATGLPESERKTDRREMEREGGSPHSYLPDAANTVPQKPRGAFHCNVINSWKVAPSPHLLFAPSLIKLRPGVTFIRVAVVTLARLSRASAPQIREFPPPSQRDKDRATSSKTISESHRFIVQCITSHDCARDDHAIMKYFMSDNWKVNSSDMYSDPRN